MQELFLVDLIFEATREIKKLPMYHSARWSAFLRFACSTAHIEWETAFLGIVAFRASSRAIQKGEKLILRLILSYEGGMILPAFTNALSITAVHGEFSSESLKLVNVIDAVAAKPVPPIDGFELIPFDLSFLSEEIEYLLNLESFTIILKTPLRLKLPPGMKLKCGPELDSYVHPDFFENNPYAITHMANSVRFLDAPKLQDGNIEILKTDITWHDLSYQGAYFKKMGGITGSIKCGAVGSLEIAARLVSGQYMGIGKSARFGLGMYVIPELNQFRKLSLDYHC